MNLYKKKKKKKKNVNRSALPSCGLLQSLKK